MFSSSSGSDFQVILTSQSNHKAIYRLFQKESHELKNRILICPCFCSENWNSYKQFCVIWLGWYITKYGPEMENFIMSWSNPHRVALNCPSWPSWGPDTCWMACGSLRWHKLPIFSFFCETKQFRRINSIFSANLSFWGDILVFWTIFSIFLLRLYLLFYSKQPFQSHTGWVKKKAPTVYA